jgi:hypothetical protein
MKGKSKTNSKTKVKQKSLPNRRGVKSPEQHPVGALEAPPRNSKGGGSA